MRRCIFLAAIILLSCNTKQKKIGKYLYLSKHATIHVDKDCEHISGVIFLDTANFYFDDSYQFCPNCFNDSTYEEVKSISNKNYKKWLCNELIKAGADIEYDVFMKRINEEDVRKRIYECAYGNLFTYEYSEFCNRLDGKYP